VVADIATPRSRKPAERLLPTAVRGKVSSRSQSKLFLSSFLVETASAFLAKRLWRRFCEGLGKTKVYHERPEMSSLGSRFREGYGGPREIREGQTLKGKLS
jgi:hypothetical protein